jgi:hypothetical protein
MGFLFFYFNLEYLKSLQSSQSLPTEINLILLFLWQTGCKLFRQTMLPKCGRVNNCSLQAGLRVNIWRILTARNRTQSSAALWRTFSFDKSAPANRKKGFYTNRVPKKQAVEGIIVSSDSELWSIFKYSRSKLKKSKTYSDWCPYQGLSNNTTLMQI